MHFWIDKRSQGCSFGRARVAASLGGGGVGLGFGPPPRRLISKPPVSATIHRSHSSNDSSRTHANNNITSNSSNNSSTNNNNRSTPILATSPNTNNNNPIRNNRSRSSRSNSSSPYQQHRHHHQQQQPSPHLLHDSNLQNRHHNQQQFQQQHRQQISNPTNHHSPHNLTRPTVQLLTVNNQDYHIPVALTYNYGAPSHNMEHEQPSLDIESLTVQTATGTAHHHIGSTPSDGHHALAEVSGEVQLLPTHLKFGMCASLFLASVFIAGAKYYFDHQGRGLDALIFCAFLTISFLALCAISLCRYVPRDVTASPSISVDRHSRGLGSLRSNRGPDNNSGSFGPNSGSPHPQMYTPNSSDPNNIQLTHSPVSNSIAAPPPPYHIAILLPPESGKELLQADDESPPPSYDKILI